jgi:4-amino-4-deoxy-L-arabinose transferase-like glycosyltransferase
MVRLPVNYPAVWGAILAIPILLDLRGVGGRLSLWLSGLRRAELRGGWQRAAFALLMFLLIAHWLVVLKPEISADGLAMHLAAPMNIAAHHQMTYEPGRFLWSLMPMGCDWTYTIVYLLGGEFAARLLNFAMLLTAVALLYTAVRRWVSPATGFLLAASFAATPIVQLVTGSLFVENFLAAIVLGLLTTLWLFSETGDRRLLFAAAILGGTSVATKYGAILFVVLALPFLIAEVVRHWKLLGARPWVTSALALFLLLGAAAPTYAIAYRKTGNPIYPFLNRKYHSPLLDPTVDFMDARFQIPVDWGTLNLLTFHTDRAFEGQNGSFGFQYLIMAPLALLGLLVAARRPSSGAALLSLGAAAAILLSTPNVRYLYTSMALLPVPFAALLAWLHSNQRWMYRTLLVYLVACTGLNAYFLPASGYYHKDFCLRLPFSSAERVAYLRDAAPARQIVDWYNTHHPDSTVLLTSDSTIAGLNGNVYVNHWHQYPTVAALQRAAGLPEMLQLVKQWGVGYFIARKPGPGDEARPAALAMLLEKCTQPEYETGEMYLARLEPDCRPKPQPEIVVTRGFYDDFDPAIQFRSDWSKDTSFEGPDRHTISYTDVPGAETSISFQGTILTYVFTKAPNRGIAAITVDGADQGTVDLYSPNVEWQSRKKLCCFGPGRHVATIRVTGQSNPRSSGRFVDLDSFEVW